MKQKHSNQEIIIFLVPFPFIVPLEHLHHFPRLRFRRLITCGIQRAQHLYCTMAVLKINESSRKLLTCDKEQQTFRNTKNKESSRTIQTSPKTKKTNIGTT
jgi:hypothetical protein